MSLPLVFRPEAEQDLISARDWYDRQRAGLGDEFTAQFADLLLRLAEMPNLFPLIWLDVRVCQLHRFPYVVYYRVLSDCIEVIGVLHGSRDSDAWRSRT